jgi:hypothetical protein
MLPRHFRHRDLPIRQPPDRTCGFFQRRFEQRMIVRSDGHFPFGLYQPLAQLEVAHRELLAVQGQDPRSLGKFRDGRKEKRVLRKQRYFALHSAPQIDGSRQIQVGRIPHYIHFVLA